MKRVTGAAEFADLLHQCHNIIRNRQKLDPAAALDEIAKILFVKVYVERELRAKRRRKNIFTVEFLDEQIGDDPLNDLFDKTKRFYRDDQIFEKDDRINLKPATGCESSVSWSAITCRIPVKTSKELPLSAF